MQYAPVFHYSAPSRTHSVSFRAPSPLSPAIVLELQRHGEIFAFQESDDRLQIVAALGRHSHGIALNGRFDLGKIVAHELRDLFRQFRRKATLQGEFLAYAPASSIFD